MSKTSRKSLPTVILALCVLVAQAALFGHLSNAGVAHAAVGPAIYTNPASNTQGVSQLVSIRGTGFTPNAQVLITFNSPYSTDGTPLSPNSIPPTNNGRPGDNRPNAPTTLTGSSTATSSTCPSGPCSQFPNVIEILANTDSNGNIVTSNGSNGTVQFTIPPTAVDGVYEIVAIDLTLAAQANAAGAVTGASGPASSSFTAATQYTVSRSPNQVLKVTPLSGSSVQINGMMTVTAAPNTFNNGDEVRFYLEDFAASGSFGAPSPGSFSTFDPLVAPAVPSLPLDIISCGTVPVNTTSSWCAASVNGDVTAEVQLQRALNDSTFVPGTAPPCVLSTTYFDQVFAIVAKAVGNTYNLPYSANQVEAGVHIDHGQTALSVSTNQQSQAGPVTVRGTGFGARSTVALFFILLPFSSSPSTNPCVLTNPGALPPGLVGPTFASACVLTASILTDDNGAFSQTVTVPNQFGFVGVNSNGQLNNPGYILAEDFGPAILTQYSGTVANPCAGLRLNEGATAAFLISAPLSASLTLGVAAGGTSTTAAISSTVTVTGTGFLANEAVTVQLTGPQSTPTTVALPIGAPLPTLLSGSAQCNAQQVATLRANASGVATGSFLVPETCNTVTVNNGRINAGAKVSVDAIGQQSGLDDSNTLTIPATSALITPVFGIPQTGVNPTGTTTFNVAVSGTGFAANEPVTFQFGSINNFTGVITTPILSLSGVTDATGSISNLVGSTPIPIQSISPSQGGGLYTLYARGLNSSFVAKIINSVPFLPFNGNLNCPVGNVLPGQPFVVSGQNFAGSTSVLASINFPAYQTAPNIYNNFTTPASPYLNTGNFPNYYTVLIPTDTSGTFTYTFTTPLGTPNSAYQLVISGLVAGAGGGNFQQQLRQCTINVGTTSPTVSVVPNSGTIGITATVTGAGFGVLEPINVTLQYTNTGVLDNRDVPGTQQTVATTDANGNFTGIYTIKSTVNALIPGLYSLTATGAQTGAVARTTFIVTGGPQAPVTALYFAEGFTGTVAGGSNANFNETLSILNANNYTTTYTVTYFIETAGPSTSQSVGGVIGPSSVVERSVNADVGPNQKVAAVVSSPAPLAATRLISRTDANGNVLDSSSSFGQLINTSAAAPAGGYNYYFASGEVLLTNEEYVTLLNPTSSAASATINIYPEAVISATAVPNIAPIPVSVPGNSRVTVHIRAQLTGAGITRFGMNVNSNGPLAAERIEYYGDGIGSGKYGAVTKPAGTTAFRQYIFASDVGQWPSTGGNGLVGTGNDLSEIDVINPNPASAGSATVTVSFFDKTGKPINSQQVQVDGGTRETIMVNDVVGTQADVFSVVATSDKNIFVEKPVYYKGDPTKGGKFAVASPSGSPAGLVSVAFPFLDLATPTGTAITQTVFLYNPGATAITVRGTYVSASQTVVKTYTVQPNSITTVSVNTDALGLPKGPLGGIFQIVQTGSGQGDSFVAAVTSNTPDFAVVVGNQGTYPVGAATGP